MLRNLSRSAAPALPFVILLALSLPANLSLAEDEVSSLVSIYVDDDSTTIVTPMVLIQKDIFEETSLSFQYLADIQSCASVDVVSTASPSMGYKETRHSFTLGIQHRRQLTTIGGGFSYSTEHDYDLPCLSGQCVPGTLPAELHGGLEPLRPLGRDRARQRRVLRGEPDRREPRTSP